MRLEDALITHLGGQPSQPGQDRGDILKGLIGARQQQHPGSPFGSPWQQAARKVAGTGAQPQMGMHDLIKQAKLNKQGGGGTPAAPGPIARPRLPLSQVGSRDYTMGGQQGGSMTTGEPY